VRRKSTQRLVPRNSHVPIGSNRLRRYAQVVLVAMHETYVAERNLEEDSLGSPIEHPLVAHFFDSFEDGHYLRDRALN